MDPRPTPLTLALILIAFSGIMSRAGEDQTKTQCTATGCSAAAPPASELSATKISECLARIANQPIGEPSLELETLLFHSKGVVPHLQGAGQGPLTAEQAKFLKHELARTHAKVELRIVDADGEVLMTFDRSVPIGEKQHLHPEESRGFTPPEISFTIHRVGLNHLWTRLWLEGRHFAAGPWFTVQKENEWGALGALFVSNGKKSTPAKVEIRLALDAPDKTIWEKLTKK